MQLRTLLLPNALSWFALLKVVFVGLLAFLPLCAFVILCFMFASGLPKNADVEIGSVVGVHGRKGKLKVVFDIDFDLFSQLLVGGRCSFGEFGALECIDVANTGNGKVAIVTLGDLGGLGGVGGAIDVYDPRAAKLSGVGITCPRFLLGEEVLPADVIGLDVIVGTRFGAFLAGLFGLSVGSVGFCLLGLKEYGKVVGFYNFGAGDIVEVERVLDGDGAGADEKEGSVERQGKLEMFPFVENVFPKISFGRGWMRIDHRYTDEHFDGVAK